MLPKLKFNGGRALTVALSFASVGVFILAGSRAATPTSSSEAESGLLSGASVVSDASASGGSAITFGGIGAQLPINYNLASITGAKLYVSPTGNDTSGNGSVGSPYKTVKKAITSAATSPTTVLVAGGTYDLDAEGNTYVDWSKAGYTLTIKALPGETPIFDGSIASPTTSTTENGVGSGGSNLKYVAYNTVIAGVGAGLTPSNLPAATFSGTAPTGMAAKEGWLCVNGANYTSPTLTPTSGNPSGCATGSPYVMTALYPDQAWYNGAHLYQVLQKDKVTPASFYVERTQATDGSSTATSLYVDSSLDLTKLRVSGNKYDVRIGNPNVTLEGMKFTHNSPGTGTAGFDTLYLTSTADNTVLRDIVLEENSSIGIGASGAFSDPLSNVTVERITSINNGWQGMGALYNNSLAIKNSIFSNNNLDGEYNTAPASGGIKFSRNYQTTITNSWFNNNVGPGMWFDQENYDTTAVGNRFIDNTASGFFYEISEKLLFANNYVSSTHSDNAFRASGSGGVKIINNTLVGGGAAISFYTDNRSKMYDSNSDGTPDRWCAENDYRYGGTFVSGCGGLSSDLNKLHLGAYGGTNDTPGMDWLPQADMIINNIMTDQTTAEDHSNCTFDALNVCFISFNGTILINPQDILTSGTIVNGNIYQVNDPAKRFFYMRLGSGQTCPLDAFTLPALQTTLAGASCYNNPNAETNGKYSSSHEYANPDGTPTATLNHSEAMLTPTDAAINVYIPAGTRHYGILSN